MTLQDIPYWWTTSPDLPPRADAPLPERVDVVVIGSGYTGLSAARRLARSGASVAVLEKESIGWGASSRNGGQVLSGLKVDAGTLIARYGLAVAQKLYAASQSALAFVETLIDEAHIECEYVRCGNLYAASKPRHFEDFKRSQELLARDFGDQRELLPRGDQRREIGSDAYFGVMIEPNNASLHPAKYVRGLAQAAERAGVRLFEAAPVLEIERDGSGFKVETGRGAVAAQDVFAATNGYTDTALPGLRRRVIPIGSYIIATEPLREEVAARLLPRRRVVSDSKNLLHYYRVSRDNRLLFGGRAEFVPSTSESTRHSAAILRRDMLRVFPELKNAAVEYAWGGNVCFTMDMLPHAGRLDNGVYYAAGYGGHGVAMATYLGAKMADVMLGRDNHNPFRDMPFKPIPFYDGRPWFLPLAAVWYKFLDWIQ